MNFKFDMTQFLLFFPIVLISIAIHEFAHCWTTHRLGDDTPKQQGRLTLNPLVHLDPFGTIMIVISSFAGIGFGWGKSSPFNPYNFRHPARDRMISAAAGPISNLAQMLAWASIGLVLYHTLAFSPTAEFLVRLCINGVIINASLAIFNLLPVYPLDGHHILGYFVPPLQPIIDNPMWGLVFLFLVFNRTLLGSVLMPVMKVVIGACTYLIGWPPPEWFQ
ncbi:MAG: site-2 protease family protein [Armatimonadota bacterium]